MILPIVFKVYTHCSFFSRKENFGKREQDEQSILAYKVKKNHQAQLFVPSKLFQSILEKVEAFSESSLESKKLRH